MSLHYDPSPRVDRDPDLQHEAFQATDDCRTRAWEWAIDAQPDHITTAVLDAYIGTSDYDTGFENWRAGE